MGSLFSSNIIGLDTLEIEDDGGGRCQVLFQCLVCCYLLGDIACHCDRDHWKIIGFGVKDTKLVLVPAFQVALKSPNVYKEYPVVCKSGAKRSLARCCQLEVVAISTVTKTIFW